MLGGNASSRDMDKAIQLVTAVGDKKKKEVLEEIRESQVRYEKILSDANKTKKEAEQVKRDATRAMIEANHKMESLQAERIRLDNDTQLARKRLENDERDLKIKESALKMQKDEFNAERKKELSAMDLRLKELDDRERSLENREKQCTSLGEKYQKTIDAFRNIAENINIIIKN